MENPQGASVTPSLEELIAKARQEDEAKRTAPSPEVTVPATESAVGAAPASMDELLQGLQNEVKTADTTVGGGNEIQKSVENVVVETREDDSVRVELEQKLAELKAKYADGHSRFGDAWSD